MATESKVQKVAKKITKKAVDNTRECKTTKCLGRMEWVLFTPNRGKRGWRWYCQTCGALWKIGEI